MSALRMLTGATRCIVNPFCSLSQLGGSLSNEVVKEAAQTISITRAHFYRLLAAHKQRPQTSTRVVFSLKKESRTGPCYSKSGLDGISLGRAATQ
jgi:hypothetical protein